MQWEVIQRKWLEIASEENFLRKFRELNQKRVEYQGLATAYQQDRLKLEANRHAAQLKRFLERHFIHQAKIKGIGPGLKATLVSYGIETAADITISGVWNVPSFGPERTRELLKWRTEIEAKFRFDPKQSVHPEDIAALDQQYAQKRKNLEAALLHGPNELQQLRTRILQQREAVLAEFRRASIELAQAKANASLL